jgi:hypothetical protein
MNMNIRRRILLPGVLIAASVCSGKASYAQCKGSQFQPRFLGSEDYAAERYFGNQLWQANNTPTSYGGKFISYFIPSFGIHGGAVGNYSPLTPIRDTPIGRVLDGLFVLENSYSPMATSDNDLSGPIVRWAFPMSYQQYYDDGNFDLECSDLNTFAQFIYQGVYVDGQWRGPTYFKEGSGAWYNESPIERASTLFHEAIHHTGREHDCGSSDSSWQYNGAYYYQTCWLMDYFEEANNFTNATLKLWAAEQANARMYDGVFCQTPPADVLNWVGAGPFPADSSGGDKPGDNKGQCASGAVYCGCPLGYLAVPPNGNCLTCSAAGAGVQPNGACCPAGQVWATQSKTCCQKGAIANGGLCCEGGTICGSECCTNGEVCSPQGHCGFGQACGNAFCGVAAPVCCGGASCCTANQCINNQCCPQSRACGGTCCAANQFCNNGACVNGCPDGMDISTSPTGSTMCCPLYQCSTSDTGCVVNSCPGTCCGQGQVCCTTDGIPGHLGCHSQSACFVAQ